MVALGVLVLMKNRSADDFAEWFIASYMIIFGTILFFYELLWWCNIGSLNKAIRKNFGEFLGHMRKILYLKIYSHINVAWFYDLHSNTGFLYSIRGKSLYMIFVAVLCIGIDKDLLENDDWLRWFSGIGWMASGVGMILLTLFRPKVFENYRTSTAGFESKGNIVVENVV